jgi:hypothetical protein
MPPGIEIAPRQIRQPLFAGTDEILHRSLGIESIRHRSSVTRLGKAWPSPDQMTSLIAAMFAQVSQNWDAARTAATKPPSSKNWRWCEPVLGIAAHNKSPEVVLERAIVKACLSTGRSDWTNQVPIASGVVGSDSHILGRPPSRASIQTNAAPFPSWIMMPMELLFQPRVFNKRADQPCEEK